MTPNVPTDWRPIAAIPDDRKDGRKVLIWAGGIPYAAHWLLVAGEGGWFSEDFFLGGVTHYADIGRPEGETGPPRYAVCYSTPAEAARDIAADFEPEDGENEWTERR